MYDERLYDETCMMRSERRVTMTRIMSSEKQGA